MDCTDPTEAQDPRQTGEKLQRGPPSDFMSDDEMDNPGNASVDVKTPTQERGTDDAEKELGNEEREHLVIKLKYSNRGQSTSSPTNELAKRNSPKQYTHPVQTANLSDGTAVVKQELEEDREKPLVNVDVVTQEPGRGGVRIKDENECPDHAAQPLSESAEEKGETGIMEKEPGRKEQQISKDTKSPQGGDEMDVDAPQGENMVRVSGNDELPNVDAGPAAHELEKTKMLDNDNNEASPEQEDTNMFEDLSGNAQMNDGSSQHRDGAMQARDDNMTDREHRVNEQKMGGAEEHSQRPRSFNVGPSNFGLEAQDLQLFPGPVMFPQEMQSPLRQRSSSPLNAMGIGELQQYHQPTAQYTQPNSESAFTREQELQKQIAEKRKEIALYRPKQQMHNSFGFASNQMSRASPIPLGPLSYQRAPPNDYLHTPLALSRENSQYLNQIPVYYSQLPQGLGYSAQSYNMPMIPHPSNWMSGPYNTQAQSDMQEHAYDEHDCEEEDNASDDDEPLATRVKRHPSVMSQTSLRNDVGRQDAAHAQDDESELEFISSKLKPPVNNSVRMLRPLPQPTVPSNSALSPNEDDTTAMDFRLPQYEVQRQPLAKNEDLPTAKVSLPGLVREELYLSPDHSDQEIHLLLNLFIPGQQALPTPDPAPAIALLNFHTVAVMVIEAFVQFEIGDEQGLGRGHFHSQHDTGEEEYERWADATEANVDEIFFAVVDRWRAGLESKKQPLELIRGAQEFCDVALDVIYYVKANGLLRKEKKKRKEKADKGVKRDPRPKTKAEEGRVRKEKEAKGVKRGSKKAPNEVMARKKAKVEPKVEVKKRARARAKPSTAEVTVITGKKK